MKNNVGIFIASCLIVLLSSCLDSKDKTYDVEVYKNCQIASFKLENDSVAGLANTVFTIDQLNGRIFNADSLPCGTEVEKVVCTIVYQNEYAVTSNKVNQQAYGDSILVWNGTDSLDFSKPVKFTIGAYDEVTSKSYTAQVNVHTVVPDSMEWSIYSNRITGQAIKEQKAIAHDYMGMESYLLYIRTTKGYSLYQAPVEDAVNWVEIALSGLPASGIPLSQITEYNDVLYIPSAEGILYQSVDGQVWSEVSTPLSVKYLLGFVKEDKNSSSGMAAIVEKEGVLTFASMNEAKEWSTGLAVPELFPLTGFGNVNYENMYREYLMVAGGRDKSGTVLSTTWGTMDGLSWAVLTDEEVDNFGAREGVMLTQYDDGLFLAGGLNKEGFGSSDIFISKDHGVTWTLSDKLVVFPVNFGGKGFSSVLVDKDQFMLVFAGKTRENTDELDKIWRGRINRLGFEK